MKSQIFFVVLTVGGIAAIVLDHNWVGGLVLIGIALYPVLFAAKQSRTTFEKGFGFIAKQQHLQRTSDNHTGE